MNIQHDFNLRKREPHPIPSHPIPSSHFYFPSSFVQPSASSSLVHANSIRYPPPPFADDALFLSFLVPRANLFDIHSLASHIRTTRVRRRSSSFPPY